MDLATNEPALFELLETLHNFYLEEMQLWAKTRVDALLFMDDWGAQRSLLISPEQWRRIFKPLYKDYIDIAHQHDKRIFMHSDGWIVDILPDLIEIGLDAINSQIFCMGPEKLRPLAGHITFWGEIDRQHLLVEGTEQNIRDAVYAVYEDLYRDGGVIAQAEFGPGARPENIETVFGSWEQISGNLKR
jgi:uroporphyrinogen-III decarboxylase